MEWPGAQTRKTPDALTAGAPHLSCPWILEEGWTKQAAEEVEGKGGTRKGKAIHMQIHICVGSNGELLTVQTPSVQHGRRGLLTALDDKHGGLAPIENERRSAKPRSQSCISGRLASLSMALQKLYADT
mmetsp:Transcript_24915/g.69460  ORF Transcript_24915/g.69460 Transcript_24915/m.69460 type:complete len:129 (-) Transcript_24915:501-887(-)